MHEQSQIASTLSSADGTTRLKDLLTQAGATSRTEVGRLGWPVSARVELVQGLALVEVTGDDQRRVWNELMERKRSLDVTTESTC